MSGAKNSAHSAKRSTRGEISTGNTVFNSLDAVLDRENVSIGSIQRILGRENRTTTEIYLHSIGGAEREAMAVYEKACQTALPEEIHTRIHTRL
jgi:hypothetical protein